MSSSPITSPIPVSHVEGSGASETSVQSFTLHPGPRQRLTGVAIAVGGASSTQLGHALGATAFAALGPVGVVAIRQFVAATVLGLAVRPKLRHFQWRQVWPAVLLGLVFASMNLFVYLSLERIGQGAAITLEFLGPLALVMIRSRRMLDGVLGVIAFGGVLLLTGPGVGADPVGVLFGLLGAAAWAAYILLNEVLNTRVRGLDGVALGSFVSALVYLPVGIWLITHVAWTPLVIAAALAAGVFSSAVPYGADALALRRLPTGLFAMLMSVHPVMGAVFGLTILGQELAVTQWVAIGIISAVNSIAVYRNR